MVRYIAFENYSFKDCFNERVGENWWFKRYTQELVVQRVGGSKDIFKNAPCFMH